MRIYHSADCEVELKLNHLCSLMTEFWNSAQTVIDNVMSVLIIFLQIFQSVSPKRFCLVSVGFCTIAGLLKKLQVNFIENFGRGRPWNR